MIQTIVQEKHIGSYPRINKRFMGLGRELQQNKKQRRKVELEHRYLENKVLLLEKQQLKAKKDFLTKRKKLQQMITYRQRIQQQNQKKQRMRKEREAQLEQQRKSIQMSRLIHQTNIQNTLSILRAKNTSDYSRGRELRAKLEQIKKLQKSSDLREKRNNWLNLNLSKQRGKSRIDSYHRLRNSQSIKQYQFRIMNESRKKSIRLNEMKTLQAKQLQLKNKLQNASLRASRVEKLLQTMSRSETPLDIRSIQAELFEISGKKNRKRSYKTLQLSQREMSTSRTNIKSSGKSERSYSNKFLTRSQSRNEYIEQNIEVGDEEEKKSQIKIVHQRRRNKHANRYKQYEAY